MKLVTTYAYDQAGRLATVKQKPDPTGNPTLVYTTTLARDASGNLTGAAVVAAFRYRAYGETAQSYGASAPSLLGYAGQLLDPSGLLYMRARWYDAATARFMSRDPANGDLKSPHLLNAFAYAYGNPVRFRDPTGLCPLCIAIPLVPPAIAIGTEVLVDIGIILGSATAIVGVNGG